MEGGLPDGGVGVSGTVKHQAFQSEEPVGAPAISTTPAGPVERHGLRLVKSGDPSPVWFRFDRPLIKRSFGEPMAGKHRLNIEGAHVLRMPSAAR